MYTQFIHLAEEGQSGTKFLVQEDNVITRLGLRQPKFKVFLTQQTCLFMHTKTRRGKCAKKVILIVKCLSEEPGDTPHDGLNREAGLTFSTLSMFSTSAQRINFVFNGKYHV